MVFLSKDKCNFRPKNGFVLLTNKEHSKYSVDWSYSSNINCNDVCRQNDKKNVIFKVMKHSFILVLIGPVNLEASTNNSLKFFPYTGTTLTIIQLIKTRFLGIILTVT